MATRRIEVPAFGQTEFKEETMPSKHIIALISAVALPLSISIAQAAENTAPGGTGVEQSTESQGATNKDTTTTAPTGSKSGPSTGTEPGTGVEDSVQGEGATNKAGKDDMEEGKGGTGTGGASSGNAPGGTGVEQSTEGQGSTNKN